MNLKKSFQYQNKLSNFIECISNELAPYSENIIRKTEIHKKSSVLKDVQDEKIDSFEENPPKYDATKLILMMNTVLKEKVELSDAIRKTKSEIDDDLDGMISLNKTRQNISSVLKRLCCLNSEKIITKKEDFTFNVEGNQVPYKYDCEVRRDLAFSKEDTKKLQRSIDKEFEECSEKIDKIYVESEVDFEPMFEIIDSFNEAYEKFSS